MTAKKEKLLNGVTNDNDIYFLEIYKIKREKKYRLKTHTYITITVIFSIRDAEIFFKNKTLFTRGASRRRGAFSARIRAR